MAERGTSGDGGGGGGGGGGGSPAGAGSTQSTAGQADRFSRGGQDTRERGLAPGRATEPSPGLSAASEIWDPLADEDLPTAEQRYAAEEQTLRAISGGRHGETGGSRGGGISTGYAPPAPGPGPAPGPAPSPLPDPPVSPIAVRGIDWSFAPFPGRGGAKPFEGFEPQDASEIRRRLRLLSLERPDPGADFRPDFPGGKEFKVAGDFQLPVEAELARRLARTRYERPIALETEVDPLRRLIRAVFGGRR